MTYRPNGPVASILFGDGYTQTRTYDASYRLTRLLDRKGTTTLRDVGYGYDQRDNMVSVTDALAAANSEAFTYTPREALAGATGPYGSLAWSYDGVGNRLTEARNPGSGTVTDSYTYPATSNRLSSIAPGGGGVRALTHDAAGNVVADGAYTYTYDAAGRMASVSVNGVLSASYQYNHLGQQVIRTLATTGVTVHSVFDFDGHRVAEYNAATGALIREYVWLDDLPVAVIEGGVVHYIRADPIGRPVMATTASGAVVWTASYLPFGGVRVTTGALIGLRFPGQWFQSESGLHQNWMRDYDPTAGRYLQADPLGLIDGASVYGYARQSPLRYSDPTGECPVCLAGVAYVTILVYVWVNQDAFCDSLVWIATYVPIPWQTAPNSPILWQTSPPTGPHEGPAPDTDPNDNPIPPPPVDLPEDWDVTTPPGPEWEWRGEDGSQPGGPKGNWHNPGTGDSIHPDFDHDPGIPPHVDVKIKKGPWNDGYRLFPGHPGMYPKKKR